MIVAFVIWKQGLGLLRSAMVSLKSARSRIHWAREGPLLGLPNLLPTQKLDPLRFLCIGIPNRLGPIELFMKDGRD